MSENSTESKTSALLTKLPDNVHAKLKHISRYKEKSMNELVNEIIADYVKKEWEQTRKAIKKELDKLE